MVDQQAPVGAYPDVSSRIQFNFPDKSFAIFIKQFLAHPDIILIGPGYYIKPAYSGFTSNPKIIVVTHLKALDLIGSYEITREIRIHITIVSQLSGIKI